VSPPNRLARKKVHASTAAAAAAAADKNKSNTNTHICSLSLFFLLSHSAINHWSKLRYCSFYNVASSLGYKHFSTHTNLFLSPCKEPKHAVKNQAASTSPLTKKNNKKYRDTLTHPAFLLPNVLPTAAALLLLLLLLLLWEKNTLPLFGK
jgi:hypothetical protein